MKKLLLSISILALLLSCNTDPVAEGTDLDLTAPASLREVPTFKGVFTTMNSEFRATVQILFPNESGFSTSTMGSNYPSATLVLQNGAIYTADASESIVPNTTIKDLEFTSNDLRLTFSVEADGSHPTVSNVRFKNMESSIIVAKHTRQAPVTPVTGTYNCINCNGHPNLDDGRVQTFNMMFTTANGESAVTTQSLLGSTQYNGIGYQDNCLANGNFTNCEMNSGDGSTTTAGYLANGNPVYWTGTHNFNNEAPGANDCSGVWGTWSWQSNSYGVLTGQFESDPLVDCFTEILFEDFEDATVAYVALPVDDISDIASEDYYGIVSLGSFEPGDDVFYSNLQGNGFYGAQDTNGANVPTESITLTWTDVNVAGLTTLRVSGFFAEDDDENNEDWDVSSSVRFEYSYNNVDWSPALVIEAELGGTNSVPKIDTDFDGFGDGIEISDAFIKHANTLPTNGNSLVSIRIIIEDLNDGDEDIAIDNVRIEGQ
ncbi:hypothetical protein [Altibacter sp.]|uniref:hypothetical protein n=1 Tax=Altibacter sp. TaxID=2024823 RepID=UPI00258C3C9C|nr:hypothetical protein [Altibacter sp.]MCW9036411.1 hypothetical protein [Altibacter sp.]